MFTLYYFPNTCALASHIVLEQAGVAYRAVYVDFRANAQREPDFLAVNPKGRVPALVTDRGVITETPAILAYIAQTCPAAGLAPIDDPYAFAQVQAFNAYLCSTVHPAHAHRVRGNRWADDLAAIEELKRKAPQVATECFNLIEREMIEGPWVLGETYSICDAYLFTIAGWLERDGVDIAQFPKVADHFARMAADPLVRQVMASEHPPR